MISWFQKSKKFEFPARVFFFPWIFPIIWWQNDANPVKNAFRYPKQNYCAVLVHIVLSSLKLTHETIQALNIWRQIFRYRQYTSQSTTFWGPIVGQQSFPIPSFSPFVDKDKGQNLNKKTLKKSWRSRATRIEVQYNKVWFTSFVMGIEKRGISWSANKAAFG